MNLPLFEDFYLFYMLRQNDDLGGQDYCGDNRSVLS